MSNLYIRVRTGFYTHRKTIRLRAILGDDAFWIPPRLWAYAAENQADGDFSGYSSHELALLLGCDKHASSMLQALKDSGFIDAKGFIHDWNEHNGYHSSFAERARKAANARWSKEKSPKPPKELNGNRKVESGEKHCLEDATSIYSPESRVALHFLNEKAGRHFRETEPNLSFIHARLCESGVTIDGIKQMIDRQVKKWRGTSMEDYLRPETLFNKTKFDGYYAAKDAPIQNGDNHSSDDVL